MPLVEKPHTFVDDTTAYAVEVNENFDVLYNLVNGNLDDANQSNRTVSDSTAPPGNTGSLTQLLSWLANRIKAILGTTSWRDTPPVTLQDAKLQLQNANQHISRVDNPHLTTAGQVGALVSVEGVSNPGGNIKLISGGAIIITGNNTAKTITIAETHSSRTDNPHATTAAQVGALVSVDGVANPGGDVDLVPGEGIKITPDDVNNRITIGSDVNYLDNRYVNANGDVMTGPLELNGGAADLKLKPGSADCCYMEFYSDSQAPTVRSGWIGYGSSGNSSLSIKNEMAGPIILVPGSGQPVLVNGHRVAVGITIMTGTVAHGGYVPVPAGYTESECSYIVSPSAQDWGHQGLNYFTHLTMYYRLGWNNEPRRVEARMSINGDHWEYGSVNYLCIAKKG